MPLIGKKEPINSLIGENSEFIGTFHIAGSLKINGKFEGEIKTDNHLIIGPTGKVKTNVYAKKVTVAGTLIGNIHAEEEVFLLETGRVLGDITTAKLHVSDGVVTEGQITITGGQQKDVHRLVEESYGTSEKPKQEESSVSDKKDI